MEASAKQLKLTPNGEGTSLSVAGGSYRIVISGKETGNAYAVIEMLVPPGGGPIPHSHADFQESFHVLEGEVEIKTEIGVYVARQGDFVNIPLGGLIHCFKNKTDQLARLWCTVVPAGLEGFFEEVATPAPFGSFSPAVPMTPEMGKKLQALAEKYGQQLYPPDYLDRRMNTGNT